MALPTTTELRALVDAEVDRMIDVRRDLHRHPELGFAETRTTARIAGKQSRTTRPRSSGSIVALRLGSSAIRRWAKLRASSVASRMPVTR